MATLESVFIKEFNRSMASSIKSKNIYQIELPEESKTWRVSGCEMYAVRGITPEAGGLYTGLNKTVVSKLPKGMVASRRKVDLVTRDFKRDANGRYIYEEVKVPKGSMVVLSRVNLNLKFGYKSNEDGFEYIDFVSNKDGREYMYIVPKKYIYKLNQTALALSVKNMKNFSGMGYKTWDSGVIFLHVIPYNHNVRYVGTKILKTGTTLNYKKEVEAIISYWVKNNIIPDIKLCNTEEKGNLILKETSAGYYEYEQYEELSLGEKEIYGSSNYSEVM